MAPPAKPTTAQGWPEGVHFSMLPGVASEPELVHHTRVEVGESELVVTVDDRNVVRVPLPGECAALFSPPHTHCFIEH